MSATTFIVDCHVCRAKVAAAQTGDAKDGWLDEEGHPSGMRVFLGICPRCQSVLVGEAKQVEFAGVTASDDEWSDIVRVFPNPPRTFSSERIPKVVTDSLLEADRCIQSNATTAACVMLGRALEAVCRDVLAPKDPSAKLEAPSASKLKGKKFLMLSEGIRQMHLRGIIDARLLEWSQQLTAFRNLAAHPDDFSINRADAQDLQIFANAIVEYIYDLSDKYKEFQERQSSRHDAKSRE